MRKRLIVFALLSLLFFFFTSNTLTIIHNSKKIPFTLMIKSLKDADVVFVGEQHTDPKAHFVELEVFKALYHLKKGKIILSLEMFERDVQPILNLYLEGEITEEEFLKSSRPWNNYKTDYRPLVEFAKEKGIRVIASNVPRRYAAMVSRKGLAILKEIPEKERKFIAAKIYYEYPKYRELFYKTMKAMGGPMGRHGASKFKEKFYKSQCVKDSTMAESISKIIKNYPDYLILHINGSFHSDYKLGTAAVLKTLNPKVKIINIKVLPDNKNDVENKIADYIVF